MIFWALSEPKIGTQNQCVGVGESMGVPVEKRLVYAPRLSGFPMARSIGKRVANFRNSYRHDFRPPWPDVCISSGQWAEIPSRHIREKSEGATFTVHLHWPRMAKPSDFDLVAVPLHDWHPAFDAKDNIVATMGAPHRITRGRLAAERAYAADRFGHLGRPLAAVMIGGSNGAYAFSEPAMDRLIRDLEGLVEDGWRFLVTCSRRTEPAIVETVRRRLQPPHFEVWDGAGDNPYLAYLAHADALLITPDSITMPSEACSTGKPVYILPMERVAGPRLEKFERFHRQFEQHGLTRPFSGALEPYSYEPLDETARLAEEIRRRLREQRRDA